MVLLPSEVLFNAIGKRVNSFKRHYRPKASIEYSKTGNEIQAMSTTDNLVKRLSLNGFKTLSVNAPVRR
jgi:hypothetical protein